MEIKDPASDAFQPEMYCLVCQNMEWDEKRRRCVNFDSEQCPLTIRKVLAGCELSCLVV